MRIDLLAPRTDVQLFRQTTEIWFNEVHFKDSPQAFWLPREVMVTVEWGGRNYRNRHLYSEYLVFSVESLDKLEQPACFGDKTLAIWRIARRGNRNVEMQEPFALFVRVDSIVGCDSGGLRISASGKARRPADPG
jgi:hypothetical protein